MSGASLKDFSDNGKADTGVKEIILGLPSLSPRVNLWIKKG